jgi:hypothetical protein
VLRLRSVHELLHVRTLGGGEVATLAVSASPNLLDL